MEKNVLIAIAVVVALVGIIITTLIYTSYPDEEQKTTKVKNISASEFQQQQEQQPGVIIDVRTQEEWDEGHLAEADLHYNLLNGNFEAQLDSLDKDETYYLYCRSGNRSGKAAELMIENGFANVYNIGGFQNLVDAGLEAEQ